MRASDEIKLTAVAARTHWRKEDARVVVDAWRESGLSQAQFARTHGVQAVRLGRWVRRLGAAAEPAIFREIRVRQPERDETVEPKIELVLREGCTIRVPRGFAAEDLRRVLDLVERA